MLPLAPALALAGSLQSMQRSTAHEQEEAYLYYDYVEGGQLRGGRLRVDPNNPLHVDTGEQHRGVTSPVTTIVSNGPSSNRIDLVIVGDGYTAGELGTYAADVDAVWPV